MENDNMIFQKKSSSSPSRERKPNGKFAVKSNNNKNNLKEDIENISSTMNEIAIANNNNNKDENMKNVNELRIVDIEKRLNNVETEIARIMTILGSLKSSLTELSISHEENKGRRRLRRR